MFLLIFISFKGSPISNYVKLICFLRSGCKLFTFVIDSPAILWPGPGYEPSTTINLLEDPANWHTSTMLPTLRVSLFNTQNKIWLEFLAWKYENFIFVLKWSHEISWIVNLIDLLHFLMQSNIIIDFYIKI